MSLFDFLTRKPKQFVTQAAFEKNLANQLAMSPQTLEQLAGLGVRPGTELKLEFFFYTNTEEKADALAALLAEKSYEVEYGASASDKKLQVITGWSVPLAMDATNILRWTEEMTRLGFQSDCEFDGWGTHVPENAP